MEKIGETSTNFINFSSFIFIAPNILIRLFFTLPHSTNFFHSLPTFFLFFPSFTTFLHYLVQVFTNFCISFTSFYYLNTSFTYFILFLSTVTSFTNFHKLIIVHQFLPTFILLFPLPTNFFMLMLCLKIFVNEICN